MIAPALPPMTFLPFSPSSAPLRLCVKCPLFFLRVHSEGFAAGDVPGRRVVPRGGSGDGAIAASAGARGGLPHRTDLLRTAPLQQRLPQRRSCPRPAHDRGLRREFSG